ncbi:MAG: phosphoadenosine phosphosulfate reductase family protein [Planctomycetaceae bacterium]|jgi:predicted phosphoadenosine phosphosulfate sulfurtransferase|nr:phosphoadenosine phosphosulfate reductase family protein [Planctomycetaceae bacterium]
MRLYLKKSVLEAALGRIHRIFDEFNDVMVSFSGGKDSTVVLDLVKRVARERNQLPVKVLFLDQEAEWEATVTYMRLIMSNPEVQPLWYQIPFRLFNSASCFNTWLHCWEPGKEWIRDKEPNSIKENTLGVDRFGDVLDKVVVSTFPESGATFIGMRAEESPARALAMASPTYKDITWGRKYPTKRSIYGFFPIYDWSYSDVWRYIYENSLPYNELYDKMYALGVKTTAMRVSSVCHETALRSLIQLSEIEPTTWLKISARLAGANTVKTLKSDSFKCPDKLPYMFKDWYEYRDYLFENLVDDQHKEQMANTLKGCDKYENTKYAEKAVQVQITTIICGDLFGTKIKNFKASCVYG